MVERWHHKPGVVGSSPTLGTKNGGVAQLARALACRAKGYEFEPRRPRQTRFVNRFASPLRGSAAKN